MERDLSALYTGLDALSVAHTRQDAFYPWGRPDVSRTGLKHRSDGYWQRRAKLTHHADKVGAASHFTHHVSRFTHHVSRFTHQAQAGSLPAGGTRF
jgi:hypothetical protein